MKMTLPSGTNAVIEKPVSNRREQGLVIIPDEIKLNAKFNESNALIERKFRMINIKRVKPEYNRNIFVACFNISELLNEIKLVNVFLKLSS